MLLIIVLKIAVKPNIYILYDVDKQIVKKVLENYVPANRRFNETILLDNIIIDDYAHHPTEIKVTYDSCKQKYPNKEKVAVFLPNTYSRTKDFMEDFRDSLSLYDKAYVMDIYCDRERQEDYPGVSSDTLINMIPNAEKISLDTIDNEINKEEIITQIASETADIEIGKIAIENINNQNLLKSIILNSKLEDLKFLTLSKINDEDILLNIIINYSNNRIKIKASEKINKIEFLEEIILNTDSDELILELLGRITNQKILVDFALNSENSKIREVACKNISSKKVLEKIYENDDDKYVRKIAKKQLKLLNR